MKFAKISQLGSDQRKRFIELKEFVSVKKIFNDQDFVGRSLESIRPGRKSFVRNKICRIRKLRNHFYSRENENRKKIFGQTQECSEFAVVLRVVVVVMFERALFSRP